MYIIVNLARKESILFHQGPPPHPGALVDVPQGHRGGGGDGAGDEDAHQAHGMVEDQGQHHPHHNTVEQAGPQGEHGVPRPQGQGVVDHKAGIENLSQNLNAQVLQSDFHGDGVWVEDGQELGG